MRDVRATLRAYILDSFLRGEDESNLLDETPLRTSGIMDSLGTIQLVTFVEETFGIELQAHETGVQQFDCVADITTLVTSKLESRS